MNVCQRLIFCAACLLALDEAVLFAQERLPVTSSRPASSMVAIDLSSIGYLPEEQVGMAVYEKCNRSVVHIATKALGIRSFTQVKVREGSGSGSILDTNGHILTNFHVIENARQITVSLHDGSVYPAEIVGQDPDTDIAVLKIEAPAELLEPLTMGNSDDLRVGQRIYAIGNPFGLERTMSSGMVSSLDRQIPSKTGRSMRSLIQLDATLNQGNSGGPLLNTRGQQVGINTAIISSDGDSAGVGFAIPSTTIGRIVPQLIQHGKVIRASIGISRVYETDKGLLIVNTVPGGPAETAGLQGVQLVKQVRRQGPFQVENSYYDLSAADMIVAVSGEIVQNADHFLSLIESRMPGETVTVTVVRSGRELSIPVRLSNN
jgi:S1-C subfamily serine protease